MTHSAKAKTAGRSSSSASDSLATPIAGENICSICLESIRGKAYLDRCLHSFCYTCITQWIKILAKKHPQPLHSINCPLCKKENVSLVHALDGHRFRRLYVKDDLEKSFFSSSHLFRWQCYASDPGRIYNKFNVLLFWKHGRNITKNAWLISWVKRDVQMLTQEDDIDVIVHHVIGVIYSFFERLGHSTDIPEQRQVQFKRLLSETAKPFLQEWTQRFVDELELFLASGLTIEAYDKVYMELMVIPHSASTGQQHTEEITTQTPVMDIFDEDVN